MDGDVVVSVYTSLGDESVLLFWFTLHCGFITSTRLTLRLGDLDA